MSEEGGKATLLVAFLVALAVVTYSEIHDQKTVPRPSRYVSAGLVYGALGIVAPFIGYPLASAFGIGMVVALAYKHYASTSKLDNTRGTNPQEGV